MYTRLTLSISDFHVYCKEYAQNVGFLLDLKVYCEFLEK